jgi:hypothetical protein
VNQAVKLKAKDTLEKLDNFATFTIKDKDSGEEKNPFA